MKYKGMSQYSYIGSIRLCGCISGNTYTCVLFNQSKFNFFIIKDK